MGGHEGTWPNYAKYETRTDREIKVYVLAPRARPELPVMRGGGGFLPGIDPSSNASLYAAMHEEEDEKHRAMFRS